VVFGRYAGQKFEFKGVKLLLIDDDAIMARAESPDGFRVYI
jgi:co-chaperonin GroES (HSP10)